VAVLLCVAVLLQSCSQGQDWLSGLASWVWSWAAMASIHLDPLSTLGMLRHRCYKCFYCILLQKNAQRKRGLVCSQESASDSSANV
jgi:hypothetical protein